MSLATCYTSPFAASHQVKLQGTYPLAAASAMDDSTDKPQPLRDAILVGTNVIFRCARVVRHELTESSRGSEEVGSMASTGNFHDELRSGFDDVLLRSAGQF
jgi:hypothetical protein